MSTTAEALEALEQLPALRADLATAAGVVKELEAERDALRAEVKRLTASFEEATTFTAKRVTLELEKFGLVGGEKHDAVSKERDALRERNAELVAALQRHAQLARTLYRNPDLYAPEHIERRLMEADAALSKARGGQ